MVKRKAPRGPRQAGPTAQAVRFSLAQEHHWATTGSPSALSTGT